MTDDFTHELLFNQWEEDDWEEDDWDRGCVLGDECLHHDTEQRRVDVASHPAINSFSRARCRRDEILSRRAGFAHRVLNPRAFRRKIDRLIYRHIKNTREAQKRRVLYLDEFICSRYFKTR